MESYLVRSLHQVTKNFFESDTRGSCLCYLERLRRTELGVGIASYTTSQHTFEGGESHGI